MRISCKIVNGRPSNARVLELYSGGTFPAPDGVVSFVPPLIQVSAFKAWKQAGLIKEWHPWEPIFPGSLRVRAGVL